jgi:hypothetical protein
MGLFNDIYIDNDLNYVVNRIKEYNEEDWYEVGYYFSL